MNLKTLIFTIGFMAFSTFGQDMPIEELPTATLTEDFYLTLDPSVPVSEYYYVDISEMNFVNEAEAIKKCRDYLSANLISNEVHYSENYIIVHIHTEYMDGDLDYDKLQTYLNQLTKPN